MTSSLSTLLREIQVAAVPQTKARLLAVSKGQPVEKIEQLYEQGQRDFGENYALEMAEKMATLRERCPDICWHYIGKIQKRQAKMIVQANWVHSVGSLKELNYLKRVMPSDLNVMLQVNIAEEPQKGGFLEEDLKCLDPQEFVKEGLHIKGLMCLPPAGHVTAFGLKYFQETRQLRDALQQAWGLVLPELSMGMSGDYTQALSAGATWIRVGTLLFGTRELKKF